MRYRAWFSTGDILEIEAEDIYHAEIIAGECLQRHFSDNDYIGRIEESECTMKKKEVQHD